MNVPTVMFPSILLAFFVIHQSAHATEVQSPSPSPFDFEIWGVGNFVSSECDQCDHTGVRLASPECTATCYESIGIQTAPETVAARVARRLEEYANSVSDVNVYNYTRGEKCQSIWSDLKNGPDSRCKVTNGKLLVSASMTYTYSNPWPSPSPSPFLKASHVSVEDFNTPSNHQVDTLGQPLFCLRLNRGQRIPSQVKYTVSTRKNSRAAAVRAMMLFMSNQLSAEWSAVFATSGKDLKTAVTRVGNRQFLVVVNFNQAFINEHKKRC